jgi:hypothetical protein
LLDEKKLTVVVSQKMLNYHVRKLASLDCGVLKWLMKKTSSPDATIKLACDQQNVSAT